MKKNSEKLQIFYRVSPLTLSCAGLLYNNKLKQWIYYHVTPRSQPSLLLSLRAQSVRPVNAFTSATPSEGGHFEKFVLVAGWCVKWENGDANNRIDIYSRMMKKITNSAEHS